MIYELILDGFSKNSGFREWYETNINSLLETAPSDSSAVSKIVKRAKGYSGELEICSCDNRFYSKATCSKLDDLITNLFDQMKVHLENWKSDRVFQTL